MNSNDDWNLIRGDARIGEAGSSALKMAILFGSVAIALALVVTSLLDRGTRSQSARAVLTNELDHIATGSVSGNKSTYTIRRSVLQPTPASVCVIRDTGVRIGEC